MCPLSQGEEVKQLGNIVPPYVRVMALLSETRSYSRTLLLHHGAFVGDGFGGADIANELLE